MRAMVLPAMRLPTRGPPTAALHLPLLRSSCRPTAAQHDRWVRLLQSRHPHSHHGAHGWYPTHYLQVPSVPALALLTRYWQTWRRRSSRWVRAGPRTPQEGTPPHVEEAHNEGKACQPPVQDSHVQFRVRHPASADIILLCPHPCTADGLGSQCTRRGHPCTRPPAAAAAAAAAVTAPNGRAAHAAPAAAAALGAHTTSSRTSASRQAAA